MKKGEVFIKNKTVKQQLVKAVIISAHPECEYLIQMKNVETGEKFFANTWQLNNHWTSLSKGVQLKFIK